MPIDPSSSARAPQSNRTPQTQATKASRPETTGASGFCRLAQSHSRAFAGHPFQHHALNYAIDTANLDALIGGFALRWQRLQGECPVQSLRIDSKLKVLLQCGTVAGERRAHAIEQGTQLRIITEPHRGAMCTAHDRNDVAFDE